MTSKVAFLEQVPMFEQLREEEFAELASITKELEYREISAVAYQRDVANAAYIVRAGRLYGSTVDENGAISNEKLYQTFDVIGDEWLFSDTTHPATLRTGDYCRLLVIDGKAFRQFLTNHPDLAEYIGFSEAAHEAVAKSPTTLPPKEYRAFQVLQEELVELQVRRNLLYFFIKPSSVLLILLFFFVPPAIYFYIQGSLFIWHRLTFIMVAIFACIVGAIFAVGFIDWVNDYYMITSKRIVHYDFDLRRFSSQLNKIPIDQVQSIETLKPNFLDNFLNIGGVKITTASNKKLMFEHIKDPKQIEETITNVRARVKALNSAQEQVALREAVESHFGKPKSFTEIQEDGDGETPIQTFEPPRERYSFAKFTLDIRSAFAGRVENSDGSIAYRKHFFALVVDTWWIMLACVLLCVGMYFAPSITLIYIFFALLVPMFLYFLWTAEDWRNDSFLLNDKFVVDIDRRPFGFGETRKQAELGNVQNVNANRPNVFATIFNFGNVQIETAGATSDISFEFVANPNQIQNDVFERIEGYKAISKGKTDASRRKEYGLLLDVYRQAHEQDRIPRRTPTDDDDVFDL